MFFIKKFFSHTKVTEEMNSVPEKIKIQWNQVKIHKEVGVPYQIQVRHEQATQIKGDLNSDCNVIIILSITRR